MQTNNGQTALLPAATYNNIFEAESAFYMKLASAALSSIDVHTILMFDEHGNVLKKDFYEHFTYESVPNDVDIGM